MYLLDSSALIQAHHHHYGFDICPGFWNWLIRQHRDGRVFSIQKVKEEIREGDETDDLRGWAEGIPEEFFIAPTAATQPSFERVSNLVNFPTTKVRYTYAAISTFLSDADYFLVAQALELRAIVVTHEGSQKATRFPQR